MKFFPDEWKSEVEEKLGRGYETEKIKAKVEAIEISIRTMNFGEIASSIANSVRINQADCKVYYDVEQDTWEIINKMIGYVADLRKQGQVTSREDVIAKASKLFIIRTFNEALKRNDGNIDKAWNKTLQIVVSFSMFVNITKHVVTSTQPNIKAHVNIDINNINTENIHNIILSKTFIFISFLS